ncbi:MAG TPA: M24 family metallopeptidase, partial [Vicinamibacterales bacterium]|nr:M24 family metallopeptidase [Vicinamibacterales bacterium]
MRLSIDAVQRALKEEGLDGWLLYDFQGSNPIASRLAGLAASGKMATRRWYYLIPSDGAPRGLVHAIERHNLDDLPGEKRPYAGREQLASGLRDLLKGRRRIAMEYSPANAIPYVSRVDAGTIESVQQTGVAVVSSGDLVQRFEAVWTDEMFATHVGAAERLYRVKDRAFDMIRQRVRAGAAVSEIEVQEAMVEWFREEGLTSGSPPNVSAQENAGNPHYQATRAQHRAIRPGEGVLIDLWGKLTS